MGARVLYAVRPPEAAPRLVAPRSRIRVRKLHSRIAIGANLFEAAVAITVPPLHASSLPDDTPTRPSNVITGALRDVESQDAEVELREAAAWVRTRKLGLGD